jgi:hypothetical protein
MKNFFYHCYLWFSRVTYFLSKVNHLHTARFALLHELKRLLSDKLDGRHILIGESIFNHVLVVSPTETQKELGNILFDGMTRAGKGLAIEANLLNWSYSAIVNDIWHYRGSSIARGLRLPDSSRSPCISDRTSPTDASEYDTKSRSYGPHGLSPAASSNARTA